MSVLDAHPRPHTSAEDVLALIVGSGFIAFGLMMQKAAGLVVGGIAGAALIASYLTHINVGVLFLFLNLPFYVFGQWVLGWPFTVKTLLVGALLAGFSLLFPHAIDLHRVEPLFAAVFGGSMIGMGLLALARHRTSVGGIGVVIVYLQRRHGVSTGRSQLTSDVLIIAASLIAIDLKHVALSVLGAMALSLVLIVNHRPGRYTG